MKTNFSLLFYLKKQKNYVNGNVPIYMRITVEGNRAEIAINRDCDPKRWNAKGGRAIGSKEEVKALNTHLDQLQNAVYYAHQCVSATTKSPFFSRNLEYFVLNVFGRYESGFFFIS